MTFMGMKVQLPGGVFKCLFFSIILLTFERIYAIIFISKKEARREIEKAKAERDDWISRKG